MLIALCKFQVSHVIVWYLYTLVYAHHPKSGFHPSPWIWAPLPISPPAPLVVTMLCMLSETTQAGKDKNYDFSHMRNINQKSNTWTNKTKEKQTHRYRQPDETNCTFKTKADPKDFVCCEHIVILSRREKCMSPFGIDAEKLRNAEHLKASMLSSVH